MRQAPGLQLLGPEEYPALQAMAYAGQVALHSGSSSDKIPGEGGVISIMRRVLNQD